MFNRGAYYIHAVGLLLIWIVYLQYSKQSDHVGMYICKTHYYHMCPVATDHATVTGHCNCHDALQLRSGHVSFMGNNYLLREGGGDSM